MSTSPQVERRERSKVKAPATQGSGKVSPQSCRVGGRRTGTALLYPAHRDAALTRMPVLHALLVLGTLSQAQPPRLKLTEAEDRAQTRA